MAESSDSVSEPLPISLVAGRYLLFDINVVTYLRRTHHICGTLIGSIPQIPQQNVFLGLPVELMPEEARLLVEKEAAYIVDDFAWHKERFNTFKGADRADYLESLRSEGFKARRAAEATSQNKKKNALAKQAVRKSREEALEGAAMKDPTDGGEAESPFDYDRPDSPAPSTVSISTNKPYAVTPTATYSTSSLPANPAQQPNPDTTSSYHLFAHLHSKDYFVMPGLRFGCDYNVYPGDPLRFHSHFAAVSYEWDEEIPMMDLIGGGRLGTRVKKAFLIGGKDLESKAQDGDRVRTFSIEWGGM
ncbi:tRNA-splicing 2 [Hyphodiscus hymeniophilus]|uniref:tRNA-splicing endonuclease subunit Sen34 n=1 Tax=Hyphodiscus hymeniophilus TaxID=353542 RepID=A0A9P6VRU8_9HELO|nr:tRNA-splicing 2 [Hyphodiscus hymeniophilus]